LHNKKPILNKRYININRQPCIFQIIIKLALVRPVITKLEKMNNIKAPEKYKNMPALK
jgi:hypothetical protein